jgi:hypothetical protein
LSNLAAVPNNPIELIETGSEKIATLFKNLMIFLGRFVPVISIILNIDNYK